MMMMLMLRRNDDDRDYDDSDCDNVDRRSNAGEYEPTIRTYVDCKVVGDCFDNSEDDDIYDEQCSHDDNYNQYPTCCNRGLGYSNTCAPIPLQLLLLVSAQLHHKTSSKYPLL